MKKVKATLASLAVAGTVGLPSLAHADTILGIYLGAAYWQSGYKGTLTSDAAANNSLDFKSDLGYETKGQGFIWGALEHPIPLLPNVKLQHTTAADESTATISGFEINGNTYSGEVDTKVDLTHTDATLYYEILDNWVSIDLGLTGRVFSGELSITEKSSGTKDDEKLDLVLPMIYGMAQFEFPTTNIYVGADLNWLEYDGDGMTDLKAKLGWESSLGLGVEVGYRYMQLKAEFDDDKNKLDTTLDGAYGAVTFHF